MSTGDTSPTNDPPSSDAQPRLSANELLQMADHLQQIAEDRSLLAELNDEQRKRFLRYASQVALPDRTARRQLRKESHRRSRAEADRDRASDEKLLAETGIRRQYSLRELKKAEPPQPPADQDTPATNSPTLEGPSLRRERACYTCKKPYRTVHHFYDSLCPDCAELNWEKRHQTCDLTGRYALVTGGRVKIGFHAALKLLRAGAHVVVVTRFPRDGVRRFLEEPDSDTWRHRLILQGVDLRNTPSVEALADHLTATLPRLDFLLNNACQTVRRPPGFYAHLMQAERELAGSLPAAAKPLLESYEDLRKQATSGSVQLPADQLAATMVAGGAEAAELSQLALAPGDTDGGDSLFPTGEYDTDQQQIDLRSVNSWRLKLAEVPTVELLEVHLVNAVAPFILNARLKPLMKRVSSRDKHIVNVSAMEGVFYRAYKTDKHPHTNMAKASLNMMTRTSAQDYAADGIHMNSVDTGWITDEDPAQIAKRKKEELNFHPPLDQIDAAARICDPIFSGVLTGEHLWGKFLKDYQVSNW